MTPTERAAAIAALDEIIAEHDRPVRPMIYDAKQHPFGMTMKIPSDEQIASMELWGRARATLASLRAVALASSPSETVGRGEDAKHTPWPWSLEHADKKSYIFAKTKIVDVYSEAYGDRENQIANANLVFEAVRAYLASTADRDAIRDEMKSVQYYATEMSERAEAETWVRNRADLIAKHITAALALIGEG